MKRKAFSIHSDYYEELRNLSSEKRGDVLLALISWATDGEHPQLDPESAMLFRIMCAQIERISKVNSGNGAQGGAPKDNHIMGAYKVIIPDNLNNQPERHEIEAAHIVAQHYNQTVEFLKPLDDYRRTTPDIVMNGQLWEIKSPVGKSRRNIERQIKRALKQSRNIIIDGRRSSVADSIFESKLHYEVQNSHSIRRLIFISKEKEILEIVWKQ